MSEKQPVRIVEVKYDDEFRPGAGVATTLSFSNPYLKAALRQAFRCSDNERITGLLIDPHGVTAYFKRDESGYVSSSRKPGG